MMLYFIGRYNRRRSGGYLIKYDKETFDYIFDEKNWRFVDKDISRLYEPKSPRFELGKEGEYYYIIKDLNNNDYALMKVGLGIPQKFFMSYEKLKLFVWIKFKENMM